MQRDFLKSILSLIGLLLILVFLKFIDNNLGIFTKAAEVVYNYLMS